jgi:hypothetical protein
MKLIYVNRAKGLAIKKGGALFFLMDLNRKPNKQIIISKSTAPEIKKEFNSVVNAINNGNYNKRGEK